MGLADAYQSATTEAKGNLSVIPFSVAKEDLTMRASNRMLLLEALQNTDSSLSLDDMESYFSLKETKERMGGDTGLSKVMTKSVGRDISKDDAYESAYAVYEEQSAAFSDYVNSEQFGEDSSHPFYQLYQDMESRVEEYAGVTGHMGGKDHGFTPQLRSMERYQVVDDTVLSYLSEKRNSYGYNEQFKVDCTDFYLDGTQKERVISALGVTEETFDKKVSDAKTMVSSSNERLQSLFGQSVDRTAGRVASAAAVFGDSLMEEGVSALSDNVEFQ